MFPYEPPDVALVVAKLQNAGLTIFPTGSRIIAPQSCTYDSDWDILVLYDENHFPDFEAILGIEPAKEINEYGEEYPTNYYGRCNLIPLTYKDYCLWCKATIDCMNDPKAVSRAYRVHVFKLTIAGAVESSPPKPSSRSNDGRTVSPF